MQQHKRTQEFT